jgi:phosphoribosylanthranilate isomerase
MSVTVKICGITNIADAQVAIGAGADALGFVFHEASPRLVTISAAEAVAREVGGQAAKVGVFVNAPAEFVYSAMARCDLSILQFHGDEPPEFCLQFGLMSVKAFRMRDAKSLEQLTHYATDAWLLDSGGAGRRGGTGEKFDWSLAVEAQKFGRPIFLAGGLTPENVADAIREVRPFGVDVSSGVEARSGVKDHDKIRRFIAAAKSV